MIDVQALVIKDKDQFERLCLLINAMGYNIELLDENDFRVYTILVEKVIDYDMENLRPWYRRWVNHIKDNWRR
jgi:hypothetical protein